MAGFGFNNRRRDEMGLGMAHRGSRADMRDDSESLDRMDTPYMQADDGGEGDYEDDDYDRDNMYEGETDCPTCGRPMRPGEQEAHDQGMQGEYDQGQEPGAMSRDAAGRRGGGGRNHNPGNRTPTTRPNPFGKGGQGMPMDTTDEEERWRKRTGRR